MKKLAFILAMNGFIQPIILNAFGIIQHKDHPIYFRMMMNEPFNFIRRSLYFSIFATIPYVILLLIVFYNVREGKKENIECSHKFATFATMVGLFCFTTVLSYLDHFSQFYSLAGFHFVILFGLIPICSIGLVFMIYFIGIAIERLQKRRVDEVK